MRIVSGTLGGRQIKAPTGDGTRPTTDRVRESMFSSLLSRTELEGASVLDAFAGTGALGIEALSRGAASCIFFEHAPKARRVLQENLDTLGIARSSYMVVASDTFAASEHALRRGAPFGIVLLDPPYATPPEQVFSLIANLAANGDLADGCVIAYEHTLYAAREVAELAEETSSLELDGKQKKYGKVGVSYLAYNPNA